MFKIPKVMKQKNKFCREEGKIDFVYNNIFKGTKKYKISVTWKHINIIEKSQIS